MARPDRVTSSPLLGVNRRAVLRMAAMGAVTAATLSKVPAAQADPRPGDAGSPRQRARTVPPTNGMDDRAMVQRILDEGPGEVVFRSGGSWTIDTTVGTGGLSPRSNTRIVIEDGASVRTMPSSNTHGRLIDIGRDGPVQNVAIEGAGELLGDLLTHIGTEGQWGHIVHITNGSANINVRGPLTIKQAWGDGIYIGGGAVNREIQIDGVIVDDCRREGIAPFWVDGCTIRNCTVKNTGATMNVLPVSGHGGPGSGIDCEPNAGEYARYVTIEKNIIERTSGCGIYVSANPGPVPHLTIRENKIVDCGRATEKITRYQANGIHVAAVEDPLIAYNTVSGSGYDGKPNGTSGQIFLRQVDRARIEGGQLSSGLGRGLFLADCNDISITGVEIDRNMYHAVVAYRSDRTTLRENLLIDNVAGNSDEIPHILVQSSSETVTARNVVRGHTGSSWMTIRGPADSNVVKQNVGIGAAPKDVLVDHGARTVASEAFVLEN